MDINRLRHTNTGTRLEMFNTHTQMQNRNMRRPHNTHHTMHTYRQAENSRVHPHPGRHTVTHTHILSHFPEEAGSPGPSTKATTPDAGRAGGKKDLRISALEEGQVSQGPADCSVSWDKRLSTPQWSKYLDGVPLALYLQTGRKMGGCRACPPQASPRQAAESEFELRALSSWTRSQLCFPVSSRKLSTAQVPTNRSCWPGKEALGALNPLNTALR